MSIALQNCGKLEIRQAEDGEFGVYAKENISKDETLEAVPFICFPNFTQLGKSVYDLINSNGFLNPKQKYAENLRQNLKFKHPEQFYFRWSPSVSVDGEPLSYLALPAGFSFVYNSKNTSNNASWRTTEKTFIFKAERDIAKDEEITTFYSYFLGQDGAIFNCQEVFNLALDPFEGRIKCQMIRFSDASMYENAKQNPIYIKVAQLLGAAKDGLTIKQISAVLPNGEEKGNFDFAPELTLTQVYSKIQEYYRSPFSQIKITFEYLDKNNGDAVVVDSVIFRK